MRKDKGFVAYFRRRLPTLSERCIELELDVYKEAIRIEFMHAQTIYEFFTGIPLRAVYRRWGNPNG